MISGEGFLTISGEVFLMISGGDFQMISGCFSDDFRGGRVSDDLRRNLATTP